MELDAPAVVESRDRVRIALLSYSLPSLGRKRGGIERVAHDLAHQLGLRGHQVTVWSYDARPDGSAYEVRSLPFGRFARSWLGHRLTMGYLGNFFALVPDYSRADVVIALGDSLLLPLAGKPTIRVMCGSALGEAMSATSPWRFVTQIGVYAQELLTAATQRATVGISDNTRKYNRFVRRVIPIGVDLSAFSAGSAERSEDPTVLFVGTMQGRKRGALLLEWFQAHVLPAHPRARLVMVSPPGPEAPGVSYHEGISLEELAAWYRRAWIYASPSSYEGFGLPYVEAMASGIPVVATPNPGSLEVLGDGRYGVLASDEEFPAAMNRLLADGALREALGAAGVERARIYALDRMIDEYEDLILELHRGRAEPAVATA